MIHSELVRESQAMIAPLQDRRHDSHLLIMAAATLGDIAGMDSYSHNLCGGHLNFLRSAA